jgi:hypothetical protein
MTGIDGEGGGIYSQCHWALDKFVTKSNKKYNKKLFKPHRFKFNLNVVKFQIL